MSTSPPSPLSSPTDSAAQPGPVSVYVLPQFPSNLILHYRNTQFHVHTFVLHHHSTYFRALFDGLEPHTGAVQEMEVVDDEGERRKVIACEVSPGSSYDASKCHHSPLVDCVHLPDK